MRVDIMIVVAAILVPTRGYSQDYSCDYGQVQSEGWSGSCEPCSGNDPTEEHLCDYTINIRQTLSCQSSNWRGTQFGSWQATSLIAFGACGPVQENDQPLCTPEKSFPAYMGVQYAGGSKLTFKTTYINARYTAGSGCGLDPQTLEVLDQNLQAQSCCGDHCVSGDPYGSCEADPSRVYHVLTCSCDPRPDCGNSGCVTAAPCTPEQVYYYDCDCCRTPPEGSPIIVSFGKGMIEFNDPREGIMFDLYGDGRPIRVSWPVNIDAFWLALDRNGNGRIDGGQELFGDAVHLKNGSRAKHGYEALAEFDENQDGRIDRSDSIFRTLIWWRRPINDHGTWMPDVMIPVDKLGVESISLESFESARQDKWGNRFRFRAPVNLTNGQNIWSFDVFIVKAEDALRPATRRIEAEPRR